MSEIITSTYSSLELSDLLGAINAEHGRATRSARTTIDHATRCGEMLLAAKSKVAHGQWESWLEENTGVSLRSSQRYMRLAANTTVSLLDGDMGIAEALEMISTPSVAEPTPAVKKSKPSMPAATVTVDAEIVPHHQEHKPLHTAIKEHLPTIAPAPVHEAIDRLVFVLIQHNCCAEYIEDLTRRTIEAARLSEDEIEAAAGQAK